MDIDEICDDFIQNFKSYPTNSFSQAWKFENLYPILNLLINSSKERCDPYKNVVDGLFESNMWDGDVTNLPFIPVRLFKHLELRNNKEFFRKLTSSGTSGQNVSKIFVDKKTAQRQTKVLVDLTARVIGPERRPMIVFDSEGVRGSRDTFSARAAGIGGFSNFGRRPHFALDDNLKLNHENTEYYVQKADGSPILGFGFTYLIWQNVLQDMQKNGVKLDVGCGSALIHGGGWKKLEHLKVPRSHFNDTVTSILGFEQIVNYYGMVEQVGSIFFECEHGYFHAPFTSEVIIRCPISFTELPHGEIGLVQLLSMVPTSYPGNSLLTEDLGVCHGEDNCQCGQPGRYFEILGRKENAEVRGCSDVL